MMARSSLLHNPKDKTGGSLNDPLIHRSTYTRCFRISLTYFQRTTYRLYRNWKRWKRGIKLEIVERSRQGCGAYLESQGDVGSSSNMFAINK